MSRCSALLTRLAARRLLGPLQAHATFPHRQRIKLRQRQIPITSPGIAAAVQNLNAMTEDGIRLTGCAYVHPAHASACSMDIWRIHAQHASCMLFTKIQKNCNVHTLYASCLQTSEQT